MNALPPSNRTPLAQGSLVSGLRVALFSGNYNYIRDGANQALNRLVDFLERSHVAVRVYSPTGEAPAFEHAGHVVSVPSMAIPRRPEYRLALGLPRSVRDDLQAFQPNLFHLSAPDLLGYKALKLAKAWGLPAIASVHTRFETYARYYKGFGWLEAPIRKYLRSFYGQCEHVLAPSESMAEQLRAEGMGRDIRIWGRGIDSQLFSPAKRDESWRAANGFAPDEIVIAFVGRLVLEKGLGVFADAVNKARAHTRARVLIVGDGPERAWFAERLGEAAFTGFLQGEDLARAYASADIFFNPSTTETFGNVTLEAMASGLPTICARATGSMSLVGHETTGFLCESLSAGEYTGYLLRLLDDAGLRRGMGAASRQRSLQYNWDHILAAVLATYRETLGLPVHTVHSSELAVAV
jgi:glycosyltransferase involved in cell wall biosynthesis